MAAELDAAEQARELITLGLNDNQGNVNTSIGNRSVGRNRRGGTPRRGMTTRSTNRNGQNQHCTINNNNNDQKPLNAVPHQTTNTVHFDSLLQNALRNQQQQIMQNVTALIQNQLANIHIQKEQHISPPPFASVDLPRNDNMNQSQNDSSNRSLNNSTVIPPEKVSNIIQNWHIKFDGSKSGLATEDFLYRVRSMTNQNLYGNHSLLCDHLHLLLVGKANEWFWKFHKTYPHFIWNTFCVEFRKKFEDIETDMDIWESINSRRQGEKESFEEFQFDVEKLVARLRNPIQEESLVRLLIRHSKPSLRCELMHLNILTLVRLREEIRTHEQFCKQNRTQPPRFNRPFVSELDDTSEVAAMQHKSIKCWNCGKSGHRYDVCFEPRSIFCYGCGKKDTYKPNCLSCNPSENPPSDARKIPAHPTH